MNFSNGQMHIKSARKTKSRPADENDATVSRIHINSHREARHLLTFYFYFHDGGAPMKPATMTTTTKTTRNDNR